MRPYKYHCRCGAPAIVKWTSIKQNGTVEDIAQCRSCGREWRETVTRGSDRVATGARPGSGVIAGRITIPQYRWGSSRLG